jgi:hypothetical protein
MEVVVGSERMELFKMLNFKMLMYVGFCGLRPVVAMSLEVARGATGKADLPQSFLRWCRGPSPRGVKR